MLRAFAAQLSRDVSHARCDALVGVFGAGGAFDKWCRRLAAGGVGSVEVEHEPLFARGTGTVVLTLGLYARQSGGGVSSFLPGEAAIAHIQERRVVRVELLQKLEALVGGTLLRQSALVALDPARQRLEADTTSRLRLDPAEGAPLVALRLRNDDPGSGGFVLDEVSQQGTPCRYRRVGSWLLLIAPARPAREIELRVRYGGRTPWRGPLDHVRPDEVILRKEALWLPLARGPAAAELELTLVHPAPLELFGQGSVVARRPLPDGRVSTTFRHRGEGFALYGGPDYVIRRLHRDGSVIELGARSADPGHLDALERVVTQALRALAPLGPYPYAELRVSESDFGDGKAGYGALSNITLGRKQAHDLAFLTHELAHGWFPGAVPAAAGYWPEGLAEYLSSWALGGDEARALRGTWVTACAQAGTGSAGAVAGTTMTMTPPSSLEPPGEPWSLQKPYVYDCPAAALAALEDRHGRAGMTRALVSFLRSRAGKPSTWDDVLEAFARALGPAAALELRRDLGARPAPPASPAASVPAAVPAKGALDAAVPSSP